MVYCRLVYPSWRWLCRRLCQCVRMTGNQYTAEYMSAGPRYGVTPDNSPRFTMASRSVVAWCTDAPTARILSAALEARTGYPWPVWDLENGEQV